ncbi:alkaline phosphatase [Hymenobacter chitinivorans]|uniref:Putative secreted protein (Por secretion system target) n=1 Tax=Hymenobacter chitinivorans DSM 11115 TaxID=1121954 RepID=A0A2M9BP44_9BACT|nr:alkaline phosphatase [Hymenobacter chitinivorans]PJJ59702.1 putative secreted protein (Por secretion system target) [Hymenobacter chitinivorans DSM 11115]
MKAKLLLSTALLALAGAAPALAQTAQTSNVIMYIGDGFGLAPKTAARMAMGQGSTGKRFNTDANFQVLALDKLKYNATVTTHSLNSWITDSAPGASVYACGKRGKQDNEVISLDPATGQSIETILEAAKQQGFAVGIVSTARITHATPAAFASHIWYRDLEDYIAAQYIAASQTQYEAIFNSSPTASFRYTAARDWALPTPKVGVELDVVLGGGSRHFLPRNVASTYEIIRDAAGNPITDPATSAPATLGRGRRADDVDLVSYAVTQRGYNFVNSRDALNGLNLSEYSGANGKKLLGLFNASHVNYEQDRQTSAPWEPSLAEMTQAAIRVLQAKSNGKGFFLIVEAGRIDHLEHANTGGISVVAGTNGNQYTVDSDKPAYVGGGEANYTATPSTARTSNVYASDYMIKEVMAFDYAVAEGRAFMNTASNGRTLIFSTSDHECGGFAVTGLHDEADAQQNGTKIRTYSGQITKSVATEAGYATPTNLVRGDGGAGGWFPSYVMTSFQGKDYPTPASPTGRRIVVAYGSNPLTNGNGTRASNGTTTQGGTPGNHTPQDIWVGAEDNTNSHAARISGQGLLDNTALTGIMANFLGLSTFEQLLLSARAETPGTPGLGLQLSPVPFKDQFTVSFAVAAPSNVSVELFNELGQKVRTVVAEQNFRSGSHSVPVNGAGLPGGVYIAKVAVNGQVVSQKTIKL